MKYMTNNAAPRVCAALLVAGTVAACGIEKQSAPGLSGPSEFGTTITLTATPDTLIQDGHSVATIRAVVRDASNQPVSGLQLMFSGQSTQPARVPHPYFTAPSVATDSNGVAQTQLIAPELPANAPAPDPYSDPVVTVMATPVGSGFGNQAPRAVDVRIIPPSETPRTGGPVAVIVASRNPVILGEPITFDGSLSTYEGLACGSHCDYLWYVTGPDVDEGPLRAVKVERVFKTAGSYTATLIVTDEHGRADSTASSVTVLPTTTSQTAGVIR